MRYSVVVAALSALAARLVTGPHPIDDAYITFRYSRNLAEGLGPVWNAGDPVEGYTNFLWMLFGEEPDELTSHAMDVALTLHAEHEFNASSFAARVAAGTYDDLHSCIVEFDALQRARQMPHCRGVRAPQIILIHRTRH